LVLGAIATPHTGGGTQRARRCPADPQGAGGRCDRGIASEWMKGLLSSDQVIAEMGVQLDRRFKQDFLARRLGMPEPRRRAEPYHDKYQFRRAGHVSRDVHVPYTVEQDEDGVWCAHAQLRPGVGANGEGDTAAAAIADLREALVGLIAEFGAPDELTLTLDVA
jgi:hypothetical protein